MNEKISKLSFYLNGQIDKANRRRDALQVDQRQDEANFEQIKANVYDIFKTVLHAADKACKGDAEGVWKFFETKLEQIPSAWAASYDAARKHDDAERMQIERIKLDAVEEIQSIAVKIREGSV